ncbi:glycoside hydrolase family 108 protein [Thioalkalivibrio sp. ALJ8]|uniref:glycoside hydrolase family 108 protein n=1 Tax=Thioalkalivibrio sp. ALJ8 TaxID=1158757 RepID=UPI0003636787|nr:glycosyl hydrolase 108 family protein [Thioalkalivibrio sp. ALJ8]
MTDHVDQLIDNVLQREGGFVDHPDDRGGPTNMGITQRTLAEFFGRDVSTEEVRDLSRETARSIYRANYWNGPGFAGLHLPPVIAELVFDAGVHHGPHQATRMLQRAAGVGDDGIIGPITTEAVAKADTIALAAGLCAERAVFFGRLITRDHSQAAFAHGWLRRLGEMIRLIPEATEL